MTRFRTKLSTLFILLIGLSVLAAGWLMASSYLHNHQQSLREHMIRELRMIQMAAPWPKELAGEALASEMHQRAETFNRIAEMRVTYIAPDGTVLGDSDHREMSMDNHLGREEVQAALKEGVGTSIRKSDTLQERQIYVAIADKQEDHVNGFIRLSMSLAAVHRDLNNLWATIIFGLLLLFVMASVISYRLARGVTRPLERMTEAAQRMSSNMDLAVIVPEGGRDEIGALASALNRMSKNLQEQLELVRRNGERLHDVLDNMPSGVVMIGEDGRITLFSKQAEQLLGIDSRGRAGRPYTDLKHHHDLVSLIREGLATHDSLYREVYVYEPEERLLQVSLIPLLHDGDTASGLLLVLEDVSAIRRLERMRSEFVANVSHELKTPVAAVKGFAETLLAGAMNDKESAQSFLTIIHEESERLNRLIGDILELSQIESRRSPLQYSPVDCQLFLTRMHELVAPDAARKEIMLELNAEEGLFLEADEDRLGQIVINLLQNGINYTPTGGKVKLRAQSYTATDGEERVRFVVSDTGIGIPKKDLPRIFERFYRVDKARSRISGGTGLGLSIVKHLVDLHHGTIRVESTVGTGSQFIIELPLLQP